MLGALVGIKSLPQDMVMKVLDFDCTEVDSDEDDIIECGTHNTYQWIG